MNSYQIIQFLIVNRFVVHDIIVTNGKHADKYGLLCDVNTASSDEIHPSRGNSLRVFNGCLLEQNYPHVRTSVFSNEVQYPLFMCI